MRTGLMRLYGKKDTVQEYIDVVIKHSREFQKILDNRAASVSDTLTSAAEIIRVIIPPNFYSHGLEGNYFIPRFVKVLKGQEVEWSNLDATSHHLEFYYLLNKKAKLLFDLGLIKTNKSKTVRFNFDLTRIEYYCKLHNNEIGTVVIYPKPEEEMTNHQQFEFLTKVFDIQPAPTLNK
jgi:plastocyanin